MAGSRETEPLLGESGSLSTNNSVKTDRKDATDTRDGTVEMDGTDRVTRRERKVRERPRSSWTSVLKIETHYKPKPISSLSPRKLGVVVCILLTELCERLSYYSVVANMVLYCTSVLNFSSNDAATVSLVFSGTTYLMPIVGGYIADAHSGMFNAIFCSALIYLVGLFLLPCSALDYQQFFNDDKYVISVEWRRVFYFLGLVLVSMGTGGIKANVGPFGALQVRDVGPHAVQSFFNWYYWFVNAGALVAYVGVAAVQQNVSFAWGYLIPVVSMLLAIVFFMLVRHNYRYRRNQGSMMIDSFIVCWQGCRKSSKKVEGAKGFFDTARSEFGGSYPSDTVDGVISVVRVLPIFFFVIMYWAIYSQMQSTFFIQGERMDLHIGSTQVPVAMLNAFNTVALILLIPLLDRVVYPCFQRFGRPLSHLHRIGIGFVLAALSMVVAAVVEVERKQELGFEQKVGDETFFASNISVFLQIPQFALVGCSEGFASISGLEFAYTQSPANMQGVMMGVFLATNGLGSYLATAILRIVELATTHDPWFPDEINDGHAEYLFYLLSGLMAVFFLAYLLAARLYTYRPVDTSHDTEQSVSVSASQEHPPQRSGNSDAAL